VKARELRTVKMNELSKVTVKDLGQMKVYTAAQEGREVVL
jgi:hypothetical protein